jgi:putative transposase
MDLKKRFSEEQIIGFLQQAEAGVAIKELCRQHGFSDADLPPPAIPAIRREVLGLHGGGTC